ncbi:MAG: PhnD/SsuA/transferrin family substrate-binding protein, partial [Rhodospirillales bacterium]
MMKRRLLLALAMGFGFGLLIPTTIAPVSAAEKVIRFGLIPSEDAEKLIKDSGPFIAALEKSLGMKVQPFVAIDYSAVIEALKSDKLEIA